MKLIFIFSFLLSSIGYANYQLPSNLDVNSQQVVARTFGFGTGSKMIADPRPLGGYDGFQTALSYDYVNVSQIKGLGTGGSNDLYFSSSSMTIGKGLFYDFDMFIQMSPPQNNNFSSYGALLRGRLSSFEMASSIISIGGLIHTSISQFSNFFGSNIYGYDLYLYSELKKFVLFIGAGSARGIHTFGGGASGLTADSAHETSRVDLMTSHFWGGVSYQFGRWVVAGVSESYFDPVYSFKAAYNF